MHTTTHNHQGRTGTDHTAIASLDALLPLKHHFLTQMRHELRTPITTMHGYLTLLGQGMMGVLTPEQQGSVDVALRNLARLNRMITDLLDYSSMVHGAYVLEARPVALEAIIHEALSKCRPLARQRHITLRRGVRGPLGEVLGDHRMLVQMLFHLLDNAGKFGAAGQVVTITAAREPEHARVTIMDHGVGMTREQLARVFAPFTQGDSGLARRYEGLGMGLTLARHIIDLHGGTINLASTPGEGTTVTVTLPAFDRARAERVGT